MSNILIRLEAESDHRRTEEVIREAFWNNYAPGADEHYLLCNMRKHPDFIHELDFVAEIDGQIVGSIAYTKSFVHNEQTGERFPTVTFGPIGVLPDFQGMGVASKLIKHSADVARELGFSAIIIFGNPSYYGRLGFRSGDRFDLTNAHHEFCVAMLALPLQPHSMDNIKGVFHEYDFSVDTTSHEFQEYEASFPVKEKLEDTENQRVFNVLRTLNYKIK